MLMTDSIESVNVSAIRYQTVPLLYVEIFDHIQNKYVYVLPVM